jgi:hypothetical protein
LGAVDQLVTNESANLGCLLHDSAGILSNLAQPSNLTNLSQGLSFNQYFFGAVDNIAVAGLAKPTTSASAQDPNQVFLRTRLTIPPILSEPGSSYASAQTIPDVYPGAGCVTVFGSGVGPATQPGFVPADGGQVVAPTAEEANVELPSAADTPSTNTAYAVPGPSIGLLLALGVIVVPALALAWGARPARRRTRRRA